MSILQRIRSLFRGEEIPDEAARIYELSKTEEEALSRLEAEAGRSRRHRKVLIGDIEALTGEEERLMEEGRSEASSVRRRIVAKQVAEIRGRIDDLMNRVDIITRRVSIFDRQVALLRDRAVMEAPLPGRGDVERAAEDALVARREFEEVAELSDLHRGVSRLPGVPAGERRALEEMEGGEEEELSFEEMVRQEERRAGRRPESEGGREALTE